MKKITAKITFIWIVFLFSFAYSSGGISISSGLGIMSVEKKGEKVHGNAYGSGSSIYFSLKAGEKNKYGLTIGYTEAIAFYLEDNEISYLPIGILLEKKVNDWFSAQIGTIDHYHLVRNKHYFGVQTGLIFQIGPVPFSINNNFIFHEDGFKIHNFFGLKFDIL